MPPPAPDRYPLAPLQRGMLFHALSTPESTMYVEQHQYRLEGGLDLAAFRAAWEAACRRHPVLRTGFDWTDPDRPEQAVRPAVELPLVMEDWREHPEPEQPERLRQLAAAERQRGFDLARAPLFRLRLVRLADRSCRLLWTYHHLILDGWSAGLVFQEAATGPSDEAPPAYRDFVAHVAGLDLAPARGYWAGRLAGFTEPTPVPIARTAGPAAGEPQRIGHPLPAELTGRLHRFARARGLTVDTVLAGAWAVVLGRYAGTDEVVFGVTSTGRSAPLPGVERMVGDRKSVV